eukprot:7835357-Heterocapsa_arctica.AAC.1
MVSGSDGQRCQKGIPLRQGRSSGPDRGGQGQGGHLALRADKNRPSIRGWMEGNLERTMGRPRTWLRAHPTGGY